MDHHKFLNDMNEHWKQLFDEARHVNGIGQLERAEELVTLAIANAESLPPDSTSYSSAQGHFALWRYCQDRFAEAEVFQIRSIDAAKRSGISDRELAGQMIWLAELQQKQGKWDSAKITIKNAIKLIPPGCLPELAYANEELASVLNKLGDTAAASSATMRSAELQKEWDALVASRTSMGDTGQTS